MHPPPRRGVSFRRDSVLVSYHSAPIAFTEAEPATAATATARAAAVSAPRAADAGGAMSMLGPRSLSDGA
eukprot:COSAG01_NODE_12096_length_1801_cov_21.296710_2_plen_69_part_01